MKSGQLIQLPHLKLNVIDQGNPEHPCILFLHGFPDFSYGWHKQAPFFEDRSYRLLIPDQRGVNLSDKPPHKKSYTLKHLGQDMLDLLKAKGIKKAHVVGHDWGAGVAWWLAHHHPNIIETVHILNCPHPQTFREMMVKDKEQLLKSAYMFFFLLPKLPEYFLSRSQFLHMSQSLKNSAKTGAFQPSDLEKYRAAWQQDMALTSMLNWYRANMSKPARFPNQKIKVPTQIIWGVRDPFLKEDLGRASIAQCERGFFKEVRNGGHWVHLDQVDMVNECIHEFILDPGQ